MAKPGTTTGNLYILYYFFLVSFSHSVAPFISIIDYNYDHTTGSSLNLCMTSSLHLVLSLFAFLLFYMIKDGRNSVLSTRRPNGIPAAIIEVELYPDANEELSLHQTVT